MKLLLTSAGIRNGSISEALLGLLGKPFQESFLVYINTASNVEAGDKQWLIDDLVGFQKLGFKSLDIVDISAVPQKIWQARLEAADVLVFGGGNEAYLMYWVEKSGLKDILPKMLKTKVYVGISAGSMITTKKLSYELSDKIFECPIGEYEHSDNGLGFINFQICPHFNSESFPKNTEEYLEAFANFFPETIYTIDNDTAIKIDGERMDIVSNGQWKKFN